MEGRAVVRGLSLVVVEDLVWTGGTPDAVRDSTGVCFRTLV